MFASVIPSMRTPRNFPAFDYIIPEGMNLAPGDLVRVPIRSSEIIGLVKAVTEKTSAPKGASLKTVIGPYAGIAFRTETLMLLERLAVRAFASESAVLHAWLGSCPKRPSTPLPAPRRSALGTHAERWMGNHVFSKGGVVETAKACANEGARTLVLAPWAARAETIAKRLNARQLTSAMPMGARYASWSSFIRGQSPILVATRLGAWLAGEADVVILDEPENDDHKQDELAPRFDARWIAETAHELGRNLIRIGLTPPLAAYGSDSPPPAPALAPGVIGVDVHRADWSPVAALQNRTLDAIEEIAASGKPITIIHPVHGDLARLRCADCSWEAVCPTCGSGLRLEGGRVRCGRCKKDRNIGETCPACGSSDLSAARPGRERLERDLRARIASANVRVLSIGVWNAIDDLPDGSLVVCTDLALMSGGAEDLRRKERLMIAFRRLADRCETAHAALCVQTDPGLLAEARTWLTPDGLRIASERELAERRAFRFPPAARLAKIIVRGTESDATRLLEHLGAIIANQPGMSVSGPFPVPRRPERDPRHILHLVAPPDMPDSVISRVLEPAIATDAIIDLDPIAFFE